MAVAFKVGENSTLTATLVITLTADVALEGALQVPFAIRSTDGDGLNASTPETASDSKGNAGWTTTTDSLAVIGLAQADDTRTTHPAPPFSATMVGSVGRPCSPGDLLAGDTIEVGFFIETTGVWSVDAMAVVCKAGFTGVQQTGHDVEYTNGNAHPNDEGDDPPYSELLWFTDDPFLTIPNPSKAATMISVLTGYPSITGVTWINADQTFDFGTVFVNVCDAPASIDIEPGANFDLVDDQCVANYQFMAAFNPPPTQRCKTCGGMLGGTAVRASDPGRWI